ncbi:hypothetical protein PIB30_002776 [Stylosanthes scabra]|uniref:AT-hook motif nuclear-localized protein n=1 Tax=Stylosanthes scabra TaxID=79078 RepID=A0ABU6S2Y9_9FABA|nr:hypothetical protein [Stylosanthes scabra]
MDADSQNQIPKRRTTGLRREGRRIPVMGEWRVESEEVPPKPPKAPKANYLPNSHGDHAVLSPAAPVNSIPIKGGGASPAIPVKGGGVSPATIPDLDELHHVNVPSNGMSGSNNGGGSLMACTPLNCPTPSGLCGVVYVNLVAQTSNHMDQHKGNSAMEPASS